MTRGDVEFDAGVSSGGISDGKAALGAEGPWRWGNLPLGAVGGWLHVGAVGSPAQHGQCSGLVSSTPATPRASAPPGKTAPCRKLDVWKGPWGSCLVVSAPLKGSTAPGNVGTHGTSANRVTPIWKW